MPGVYVAYRGFDCLSCSLRCLLRLSCTELRLSAAGCTFGFPQSMTDLVIS